MTAIFKWLLSAFFSAFGSTLADMVNNKRVREALQELGRAKGADETNAVIGEISDAQASVNAKSRGDASSVADRLRERATGVASGNSPTGGSIGNSTPT